MYFGSVKFFRHLILTVVFGWLAAATVLAVFFGIKCHNLTKGTDGSEPQDMSAYIAQMNEKGYSSEEILEYIRKNDNEAFRKAVSEALDVPAMAVPQETVTTAPLIPDDEEGITSAPVTELSTEETAEETEYSAEADITESEAYETEYTEYEPVRETEPAMTTAQTYETKPVGTNKPVQTEAAEVSDDYTGLYSSLYTNAKSKPQTVNSKTVFLTFNGGPSVHVYDLITILDRQDAAAAFFISDISAENSAEYIAAIAESGNAMGILAGEGKTYASVEEYLADFEEIFTAVYDVTGIKPVMYRIENAKMSAEIRAEVNAELERRGFVFCGFNADSDDRRANAQWTSIYERTVDNIYINSVAGKASVVLMHDSYDDYTTVLTTEDIIYDLKAEGYRFAALDETVSAE